MQYVLMPIIGFHTFSRILCGILFKIVVYTYHYVITLGLCSKYDVMVTISD